ncbi:hypothetical protein [Desulfonema ishimotonii]|uniref:hypothetical protein n=1 Tax=Desulfonema ishimotonii TaxID=45657 RepID=UPI00140AA81C|nr:hypothetical protein [Desulfonema ishimotonii]
MDADFTIAGLKIPESERRGINPPAESRTGLKPAADDTLSALKRGGRRVSVPL